MTSHILPALRMFLALTLLTGVVYPVAVTLAARTLFPRQAGGSLLVIRGRIVGSEWLAQSFTNAAYFHPRPSASDFQTVPSGASNLGPTSRDLAAGVAARAAAFRAGHGLSADAPVPSDMLLASGSGLDPHIRPESARLQAAAVARARGFSPEQRQRLDALVESLVEPPTLGLLGEPRVNVLTLNLALDRLDSRP